MLSAGIVTSTTVTPKIATKTGRLGQSPNLSNSISAYVNLKKARDLQAALSKPLPSAAAAPSSSSTSSGAPPVTGGSGSAASGVSSLAAATAAAEKQVSILSLVATSLAVFCVGIRFDCRMGTDRRVFKGMQICL